MKTTYHIPFNEPVPHPKRGDLLQSNIGKETTVRIARDLTGQQFFRLFVIARDAPQKRRGVHWRVKCECGKLTTVRGDHLLNGKTVSCGCYGDERRQSCNTTHGAAGRGTMTPTYRSWESMKKRCLHPDAHHKKYYGEVRICERWLASFENFLADMGERPEGKSLDRYPDKNGNYEPGNCRWATHTEQMRNTNRNRLITIDGKTRTCSEWGAINGVDPVLIHIRIERLGWTPEGAVLRAVKRRSKNTEQHLSQ